MKKLNTKMCDKVAQAFVDRITDNNMMDNIRVYMGADFAYIPYECSDSNNAEITYTILVSKRMDDMFYDYAKSLGLKVDCGIFILSLLHEVGHHITYDDIDVDTWNYDIDVKATLTDSDEDCQEYFRLESEKVATQWAVNFINNHYVEVERFAEDMQNAIAKFIEVNEIELAD